MAETRLRQERDKRGQSTYEVAEAAGVSQSHYSRVERGEMGASLEIAERLANHFELKVTDLFSPNRSWLTAAIAEKPPARRRTEAA